MNNNIFYTYGIKLDQESLIWGSILPDVLPKYKFIRHYKDESLDYLSKEIIRIIYNNKDINLDENIDPLTMKILSKRIGIVSHYISDYTCLPHAKRWTFKDNMFKHLKYEAKLTEHAKNHNFKKNQIDSQDIDIYETNSSSLNKQIQEYINNVIEEYSLKQSFNNDLNFALSLNSKISGFILDMIKVYSEELEEEFILEI